MASWWRGRRVLLQARRIKSIQAVVSYSKAPNKIFFSVKALRLSKQALVLIKHLAQQEGLRKSSQASMDTIHLITKVLNNSLATTKVSSTHRCNKKSAARWSLTPPRLNKTNKTWHKRKYSSNCSKYLTRESSLPIWDSPKTRISGVSSPEAKVITPSVFRTVQVPTKASLSSLKISRLWNFSQKIVDICKEQLKIARVSIE